MAVFAVRRGRETGIFRHWQEVKPLVHKYSMAEFKKFNNIWEAVDFLEQGAGMNDLDSVPEDTIRVTVDGSYNHQRKIIGWAFVVTKGKSNEVLYKRSGYIDDGPDELKIGNIAGEVKAALEGIKYVLEHLQEHYVVVQYDYEGIKQWVTGYWRVRNEVVRKYRDEIAPYYEQGRIVFLHVDTHKHELNVIADKMARQACQCRTKRNRRKKRGEGESHQCVILKFARPGATTGKNERSKHGLKAGPGSAGLTFEQRIVSLLSRLVKG